MIDPAEADRRHESIDLALQVWCQGDFVIGPIYFAKRFDPDFPLNADERGQDYSSDLYEEEVSGIVVLTQTCDLIRGSKERPYFEASPLVPVRDPGYLEEIRKGQRPRYAFIPGTAARMLVADLDRVMTVEKTLLTIWPRQEGCATDLERRFLADALARKRARFAFPNDFVTLVADLKDRIVRKHDKDSPEGKQLRSLQEIRVTAVPSWDSPRVSVMFWFIVEEGVSPSDPALRHGCKSWIDRLGEPSRFSPIDYDVVTLDDISAREYVSSDRLDLDHLSKPR